MIKRGNKISWLIRAQTITGYIVQHNSIHVHKIQLLHIREGFSILHGYLSRKRPERNGDVSATTKREGEDRGVAMC